MNKKAAIQDSILVIVFIFIIAISFLVMSKVWNQVDPELKEQFNSTYYNRASLFTGMVFKSFDILFVFVIIGFFIFLIISVFLINTHPAFFVVSLILLLVSLILAPLFANVYSDIEGSDEFATESAEYDIISFVFSKYPLFALIAGILVLIALYAKTRLMLS